MSGSESLWYKDAIFYEVYPRGFHDANGDGDGDLIGLTNKLDYLQDLGIDCLWLMPIYASPLKDDGYDIADFRQIHPTIGTVADFEALTKAAHARGIRIIADLVVNHTSDQHPWFQEARRDPTSPKRNYYVWSDTDQQYQGTRIIFRDTETSNWTWDPVARQYFWHRFYSHQPDLNFDNPMVKKEMLDIMAFWLDRGIDGFRVDAVPYLIEREGTNCENLPETHVFLKEMRQFVDSRYPGTLLLAEANQWPADLLPYFGQGDEFHMAFNFPLMPRLFMAIRREDQRPIIDIINQMPEIPATCQWALFLRNHDELTLEMVTDEERDYMYSEYARDPRMRLNLGIRRRLAPLMENGRRQIELLHSLLFTLPGSPVLYYGDEIGMGDNIHLGDRREYVHAPCSGRATAMPGFRWPTRRPSISQSAPRPRFITTSPSTSRPNSRRGRRGVAQLGEEARSRSAASIKFSAGAASNSSPATIGAMSSPTFTRISRPGRPGRQQPVRGSLAARRARPAGRYQGNGGSTEIGGNIPFPLTVGDAALLDHPGGRTAFIGSGWSVANPFAGSVLTTACGATCQDIHSPSRSRARRFRQ